MMIMIGTVLGPGTIFLMLVGAINSAFGLNMNDAFIYNLIPILGFMIVCYSLKTDMQLFVAQILSAAYALLMMAVVVGIIKQVKTYYLFNSKKNLFYSAHLKLTQWNSCTVNSRFKKVHFSFLKLRVA